MVSEIVAPLIRYAILGWFFALGGLILYQLVADRIVTTALVRRRHGEGFAFHRLQLIGVTLVFAAGYVVAALGRGPGQGMPDISTPLLAALLGSHAAYLGGKLLN